MLGYVVAEGQGEADRLIAGVARTLTARGLRIAGAVQVNLETDPVHKCLMDLHILQGDAVVRISQDLGALSQGCRLDPEGLERAVGLVQAALAGGADLVIVNKFGKQEIGGRGFRPVINEALSSGIPVLTAVNAGNLPDFESYAEGLGERLVPDAQALSDWAGRMTAGAQVANG
jgi:nucleoside-triphosphatase THEP1